MLFIEVRRSQCGDVLVFLYPPQISQPVSPHLGSSVRYFIMKSSSIRNIEISQKRGIWSTTPNNENKLSKAFLDNNLIVLIFSVQGSGRFQVTAQGAGSLTPRPLGSEFLPCVLVLTPLMCSACLTGLCSHDIGHQSGELPGLGLCGTGWGFQCGVDLQGESFFPVHSTHPEPLERQ